jgi:tryptophanyl-tRNA synthetase
MFQSGKTKFSTWNSRETVLRASIIYMVTSSPNQRLCYVCILFISGVGYKLMIKAHAKRIMSLTQPTEKKMSKSDTNSKSRILIMDSREEISRKIKAAVTDSEEGVTYDPVNRPEIANLVNIMHFLRDDGAESPADLIKDCSSKSALKSKLTDCVDEHLAPIRARYEELMDPGNDQFLKNVADEGAANARESADATMIEVRGGMGLG